MRYLLILLSLALVHCGVDFERSETLTPIFDAKPISESAQEIYLEFDNEIEPIKIERSALREFITNLFGWIPIVGDILELPLDLGRALIPNLPANELIDIPKEASLDDPDIKDIVKHIYLEQAYLTLTPEEDLPKDVIEERCYLVLKCYVNKLTFIDEIRVYIARKGDKKNGLLIAQGNKKKHLSEDERTLYINPIEGVNLKTYLEDIDTYEIRTLIRGKHPRRNIYIEGGIQVSIKIKVNM